MKVTFLRSPLDLLIELFKYFMGEVDNLLHKCSVPCLPISAGLKVSSIDILESIRTVQVTSALPGIEEQDIKINIEGNCLVISGEKKQGSKKDKKDWHVFKRSYVSILSFDVTPFLAK